MGNSSVSQLLVDFFSLAIKPEETNRGQQNWDEEDEVTTDNEQTLSPQQTLHKQILEIKLDQLTDHLIQMMSMRNEDSEKAINAKNVMIELLESNQTFGVVSKKEHLLTLAEVCRQGSENLQLQHALQLMQLIIAEFSNVEKEIPDERKTEMFKLFQTIFTDVMYNCLMLLYEQATDSYINQSGHLVQKVGPVRLRAMELMKTLIQTAAKIPDGRNMVSPLLRRKVIRSVLWVLKQFPYASACH